MNSPNSARECFHVNVFLWKLQPLYLPFLLATDTLILSDIKIFIPFAELYSEDLLLFSH